MNLENRTMNAKKYTEKVLRKAYRNFDKWDTYGLTYDAIKMRRITLKEVCTIAYEEAGIHAGIIVMRMDDIGQMLNPSRPFPYANSRRHDPRLTLPKK